MTPRRPKPPLWRNLISATSSGGGSCCRSVARPAPPPAAVFPAVLSPTTDGAPRRPKIVPAEPTINDFLALIDWHIARARDRAARAVNEVRGKAAAAGAFHSGGT